MSHFNFEIWQCRMSLSLIFSNVACRYQVKPIGPATRCDEIDHFAAILRVLGASQPIAAHRRSILKITAVWPVSYSRWNVFIFSCDVHRGDGNLKYLTDSFDSHITLKVIK